MSINRTPFTRKLFSDTENQVIKMVGKEKLTIQQITERLYGGRTRPFNAQNYVAFVVRQITKKCDYHKLDWTLEGEGIGRGGRTVHRTKRL